MTLRQVQLGSLFALSLVAIMALGSGVPALIGPTSIAPLVDKVKSTVVNISATKLLPPDSSQNFFRRSPNRTAIGSGVIIDAENGYVVTNEHVIRDSEEISVTLEDGRKIDATLVGDDPAVDIAVLQISADNLTAVPLADSDNARVGDFVLAIGSPFELQQTVTSGIVSALGRKGLGIEDIEDFIQTDAAINQGNSGGPLINFSGELIGINTAIVGGAGGSVGIGFAIPSNLVKDVVEQLIEFGGIIRGFLGIEMVQLDPSTKTRYERLYNLENLQGVLVSRVVEGTAADDAGIQDNDFITSFDGETVSNPSELSTQIKLAEIGNSVPVGILRDGKSLTLYAEVRPKTKAGDLEDGALRGAIIRDINPQDPDFKKIDGDAFVIHSIAPDSLAAKLGLEVGDVILDIVESDDPDSIKKAIEILREGEALTIPVP